MLDFGEPGERRWRPGTVVAAGLVVLVLLGAAAVVLFGGNRPAGPAGAVLTGPLPAAPQRPVSGRPAPLTAAVEPLLSPPAVSWQLFQTVALPFSPTAGPADADGPVLSGYERSQTGALIAAVQLATRFLITPGEGWRQVVDRQVLPGPGREAFITARAGVEADDPPGTYGQIAGFRVLTFTPDVAVVQLVSRFALSGGRLQVSTATVKWVDGDWRLELQPDGAASPTAHPAVSLDGFVVWGGG